MEKNENLTSFQMCATKIKKNKAEKRKKSHMTDNIYNVQRYDNEKKKIINIDIQHTNFKISIQAKETRKKENFNTHM